MSYAPPRKATLRAAALSFATAALLLVAADTPRAHTAGALAALPPTMLWAWERPEDLRWLPPQAGVAYVAVTVELAADKVRLRRRAYPLLVRPDTAVVPMVHVDASWRLPPVLSDAQRAVIVDQVLAQARTSSSRVVQLDFEVRRSQRAFLRAVVADIRRRLPPDVALSATALASWCAGDYWISRPGRRRNRADGVSHGAGRCADPAPAGRPRRLHAPALRRCARHGHRRSTDQGGRPTAATSFRRAPGTRPRGSAFNDKHNPGYRHA
ncbi:hypothetical protein LP420_05985 [Massilia sp. B-10]|nr:hypothetical protein LP420_05985 [Massilia sp. B-10]